MTFLRDGVLALFFDLYHVICFIDCSSRAFCFPMTLLINVVLPLCSEYDLFVVFAYLQCKFCILSLIDILRFYSFYQVQDIAKENHFLKVDQGSPHGGGYSYGR